MCDKAVSEDSFIIKYSRNRYKTREMCNTAVDDFLVALKFVSDWFVTSKMIKNLRGALFQDDNILFFDENSGNVTFSSD